MPTKTVLVADDSRNIVNLIEYNFTKSGYKVIDAYDGIQALAKAFAEAPDIIILDINMPLKDGFEVCKTLRSNPLTVNVPIIILSARSKEFDKITGFGLGADDYMTKPFKVEELIGRANSLLLGEKAENTSVGEGEGEAPIKEESGVIIGDPQIDSLFNGKLFKGANILLTGPLGTGKSTVCRKFIAKGLAMHESSLYVSVEDVRLIADSLNSQTGSRLEEYKNENMFRLVSALDPKERDFEEIVRKITGASEEIEQSIQRKKGGRRVIDSVSGLFTNYGETKMYQFLSQIIHTSASFGGVTTFYTLEEGELNPQQSAAVKSLMDGVIELKNETAGIYAKVLNMKWIEASKDKVRLWSRL